MVSGWRVDGARTASGWRRADGAGHRAHARATSACAAAHLLGGVVDVRLELRVVQVGRLGLLAYRLVVQLGQRPVRVERAARAREAGARHLESAAPTKARLRRCKGEWRWRAACPDAAPR
eukprot:5698028-Prymnesium_polylepis.2